MIAHVNGVCADVQADKVTVDVNGLGFEVFVPAGAVANMPGIGEEVMLYTHMSVREDGMSLYGFLTRDELAVFRLLIGVSGIGPKGALGILSALGVDDLRFAIVTGDAKAIARAPGIGKKTAERLVLDLRDKFNAEEFTGVYDTADAPAAGEGIGSGVSDEAIAALTALGYSHTDAMRAVRSAKNREGTADADTETLLKAALKELI